MASKRVVESSFVKVWLYHYILIYIEAALKQMEFLRFERTLWADTLLIEKEILLFSMTF